MKTIWKFPFAITDHQAIDMPEGAKLLSAELQGDQPCLWALVEDDADMVPRLFIVKGTGHPFQFKGHPESPVELSHVSTFQQGTLVWHLFDAGEMAKT